MLNSDGRLVEGLKMKMKKARDAQKRARGFTLIELIVVVTILAILAGVLGVKVIRDGERAKVRITKIQLSKIQGALERAALDTGHYPSPDEGLLALTQVSGREENWGGPYLDKKDELVDPWKRPIQYRIPCQHGGRHAYDLFSFGPNGVEDSGAGGDDVRSWE